MGVASGCGCKEVYRFHHTTYPYSSCICSFLQQHLNFFFIKKNFFFVLVPVLFVFVLNKLFAQYKLTHIQGNYGHPTAAI